MSSASVNIASPLFTPELWGFTLGMSLSALFYAVYQANKAWKAHSRQLTWLSVLSGLNLYVGGVGNIFQGLMHSETQSCVYRNATSQHTQNDEVQRTLRELTRQMTEAMQGQRDLLDSIQTRLQALDGVRGMGARD